MLRNPRPLPILSENPLQQIWLHLSAFESVPLCERTIRQRAEREEKLVEDDLLKAKAIALAYFMRNAREYFSDPPAEWTKRILVSYYGLLSFACALLVADPSNDLELSKMERATAHGHGLGSIDGPDAATFPESPRVYVKSQGFFVEYLRNENVDTKPLVVDGSISKPKGARDAWQRGTSLQDLIARVPELAELYHQVTGKPPLSVAVYVWPESESVSVRFKGVVDLTEGFIRDTLQLPMEFQFVAATGVLDNHWIAHVANRKERPWWKVLRTHQSSMSYSSWFKPVLGVIHDPVALHLMPSYLLSILVRYRPSVWRELVADGGGSFYPLIRAYIEVVHRVVPEFVLEQLIGRQVAELRIMPGLNPFIPVTTYG